MKFTRTLLTALLLILFIFGPAGEVRADESADDALAASAAKVRAGTRTAACDCGEVCTCKNCNCDPLSVGTAAPQSGRLTWYESANEPGAFGLFRGDDQVGRLAADGFRLRFGPGDYSEPCNPPIPLPSRAGASASACTNGQCGVGAGGINTAFASPQGDSSGGCSGGSCGAQSGAASRGRRTGFVGYRR